MQPVAALAGSSPSVVWGNGACTSESTRNISGRNVIPLSTRSGVVSVKWSSQAPAQKISGGGQAFIARFSFKRALKTQAAASTEDGMTVDLKTLEEELELDTEVEPAAEEGSALPEEDLDTTPKANVKFLLRKQCHFGQQYNVVGDIPELGEWDPSAAIPMVWTEGHVWSAEVPIPVGLTVKYKYVMTGKRLELEWQPGDDKTFETKDESDITISEFWDDAESWEDFAEEEAGEETEGPEQEAASNGLATSSEDVVDELVAAVAAVGDEDQAPEESLEPEPTIAASSDQTVQVDEAEEVPEISVVEAAVATAVAEVSEEVEEAAAAEI